MIKKTSFPSGVLLLIFSSSLFISCTSIASLQESAPVLSLNDMKPIPELTPSDVVGIQLTALKESNSVDQGIALAYRFASPRNKNITGSVEAFASMIRREPYSPILYNVYFELGPVEKRGAQAFVAVRVVQSDYSSRGYFFVLTRQKGGKFDDCWMTDGVLMVDINSISAPHPPATFDT